MGFRGNNSGSFQTLVPLTPVVKRILIGTVGFWFLIQIIVEGLILKSDAITSALALVPAQVLLKFHLWQVVTYMFVHSANPTHILFNMLLLWWLGSELEQRWGARFFGLYYFVCGIGAALVYVIVTGGYWAFTMVMDPLLNPVVGASGAVFGLMLAYGIVFSERIVSFMFLFQMKAKYFVMILCMIEVVIIINNGIAKSAVANLAHLAGAGTGFLFLWGWARYQARRKGTRTGATGSKLKIVVNNDNEKKGPKLWH